MKKTKEAALPTVAKRSGATTYVLKSVIGETFQSESTLITDNTSQTKHTKATSRYIPINKKRQTIAQTNGKYRRAAIT